MVGTIELCGAPEFVVADRRGTVYVNFEDKNEVFALDSRTLTIKSRSSVAPAGRLTALAVDIKHGRLFSAGRNPQVFAVMEADNGQVIQLAGREGYGTSITGARQNAPRCPAGSRTVT